MFRFVLTLLKHRVTYRFLVVLVAALGCASIVGDTISALESSVCAILSCSD
ncbi:hypothetical protein PFPBOIHM_00006 [Aeromonas phage avDM11-UST]|nr:hypothetical protein PFPBOIHM_00006 [Aeromonas phage avDM11-UST]